MLILKIKSWRRLKRFGITLGLDQIPISYKSTTLLKEYYNFLANRSHVFYKFALHCRILINVA